MKIKSIKGNTLKFTRVRTYVYMQVGDEQLRYRVTAVEDSGVIKFKGGNFFDGAVVLADKLDALKVRKLIEQTKVKPARARAKTENQRFGAAS